MKVINKSQNFIQRRVNCQACQASQPSPKKKTFWIFGMIYFWQELVSESDLGHLVVNIVPAPVAGNNINLCYFGLKGFVNSFNRCIGSEKSISGWVLKYFVSLSCAWGSWLVSTVTLTKKCGNCCYGFFESKPMIEFDQTWTSSESMTIWLYNKGICVESHHHSSYFSFLFLFPLSSASSRPLAWD